MITASEIQETLRDLITQFGPPSDSNYRMYSSVLNSALAHDPREAGLLELSIDQKIPARLFAQKENPQIIDQLVQELQTTQQINGHAAEWMVKTWAKSMGMNVPSYQSPVQGGMPTPNTWNNPQQPYQPPGIGQTPGQVKLCPGCGKPLPENADFCQFCGIDQQSQPRVYVPPIQQEVMIQGTFMNHLNNDKFSENELNGQSKVQNSDPVCIGKYHLCGPHQLRGEHRMSMLTGTVSNLKNLQSTSGDIKTPWLTGRTEGKIRTKHWITFRVNNRPVKYEILPDISNGDIVTVIGDDSVELTVCALRNHSTGVIYPAPARLTYRLGIALIILGILSFVVVIGIPIFMAGVDCLRMAEIFKLANEFINKGA